VCATVAHVKSIGFTGVILAYAKEFPVEVSTGHPESTTVSEETPSIIDEEIMPWKKNTLKTVGMVEPGDFASIK